MSTGASKTHPQWLVGIDLGTSHTVVAAASLKPQGEPEIQGFQVPQLVGFGEVGERPLLPSVQYQASSDEVPPGGCVLPWETQAERDVRSDLPVGGALARQLGAKSPGRLVSSAKSWLSHPSADRTAPILPWGGVEGVDKISPVEASAGYLRHVRNAWNDRYPNARLEQQDLTITVPASFDEAARTLTCDAARAAGFTDFQLLEEPQAVFYDWLWRERHHIADQLKGIRLVLVVDLGGGTLDLTLISVKEGASGPEFTRIAVGQHLMLGGDNLDLSLAHLAESKLASAGQVVSPLEFSQLVEQCRQAKEVLLSSSAPETVKVTLLGGGSRLIGGARSIDFERSEVQSLLMDGFFPWVELGELPDRRRSGVVEYGLPFVRDPAITRHISAFLTEHRHVIAEAMGHAETRAMVPDALLLNGGVFNSPLLKQRLMLQFESWGAGSIRCLENPHPEESVAHGAVASAWARRGKSVKKITSGAPRSLFLVLEREHEAKSKVCCLLPRGTEEGQSIVLSERRFKLKVGAAVQFHLVASQDDYTPPPGTLAELDELAFKALPPLSLVMDARGRKEDAIEVQLVAALSPVGTLDLQCVAVDDPDLRWKIEFELRSQSKVSVEGIQHEQHPHLASARELILGVFGPRSKSVDPKAVKRLRSDLERLLGPKEDWGLVLLRGLAETLVQGLSNRRRSPDHERVWLNLTGFCLRPGFGHPLDETLVTKVFEVFPQAPQFSQESQVWSEWWTLWRRVAGGLDDLRQSAVFESALSYLEPSRLRRANQAELAKKRGPEDLLRLVANLEHLSAKDKLRIGGWLMPRIGKPGDQRVLWWSLGRLGARKPWHGSSHNVIPSEAVQSWLDRMMGEDFKKNTDAALSAALIARYTGDRLLDIDVATRDAVVSLLQEAKLPESWVHLVSEVSDLSDSDEQRVLGETLPPGLVLITS